MGRELQMGLGMWLICAGTAGYERYMLQGDVTSALIDLAISFVGVWVFSRGLKVEA